MGLNVNLNQSASIVTYELWCCNKSLVNFNLSEESFESVEFTYMKEIFAAMVRNAPQSYIVLEFSSATAYECLDRTVTPSTLAIMTCVAMPKKRPWPTTPGIDDMALAAAFASLIGSCKMKFYFKDCHQEIPTSKDCWIVEYEVSWSPCHTNHLCSGCQPGCSQESWLMRP